MCKCSQPSVFDRGSVFVATAGDKAVGNIYVLVRESRPDDNGLFAYNLLNLETGKMRYTESHRVFWTSEPIPASEINDRFTGLGLVYVADIADFVPAMREMAVAVLTKPDPRALALAALRG